MIGEWIEGVPGGEALDKGLVDMDDVIRETAKLLRKAHTVTFDRFGRLPFEKGERHWQPRI